MLPTMLRSAVFMILSMPFVNTAGSNDYTPCDPNCTYEASADQLAATKIRLFRDTIDNYTEVPVGSVLLLLDELVKAEKTVIYVYGWTGELFINQLHTDDVIRAFLSLKTYNVLLLNWNNIAFSEYSFSARSVRGVGWTLATALNKLVAAGLNKSSLYIVGHSQGAHVSGFAGRYANFTVPRITGLDPAGPLFEDSKNRLNSSNAKFVDIIHTDIGAIGINASIGHVDFYPNGGRNIQPGCLLGLDICSHFRAVDFFAESVTNPGAFIGRECTSYETFLDGLCSLNPTVVMGYATPTTARGVKYLQTNSQPPYGRGKNGTL